MHRQALLSTILSLLLVSVSFCSLHAQIEINVKLSSTTSELGVFFARNQNTEINPNVLPENLTRTHAFTQELKLIQSINPNQQLTSEEIGQIYTLRFADEAQANTVLQQLNASGAFEWIEETRKVKLDGHKVQASSSNTRLPLSSLSSQDDSIASQWYHKYIRTFEAWEITRGSREVKVGVIDTGLDYTHPEFEGQIAIRQLEDINGNGKLDPWPSSEMRGGVSGDFDGIDNDNNGYTDDVIGYDFTNQPRTPFGGDYLFEDADPFDDNDHGTLVSGVIAAKADNGWGGAGIAPNCKLVVIRAFSGSGVGEDDDIARGIIYAADNGVKILNFSFGDIYPSRIMLAAIRYAYNKGVIMVSSAGNGTGDELHYPSGFDEVISVSATAADLARDYEFLWPVSSYGVTVDLAAPGSGIFTPVKQDTADNGEITRFGSPSGTSTAAPMVSAAVALLFSTRSTLSPQQVRGILTSSADDISDDGWDHFTGAGRLNIWRALSTIGASNVQITSPNNDGGSAEDIVYIKGTVLDPEFKQYHLEYQMGIEGNEEWTSIIGNQQYQIFNDTLAKWDISALADGDYTLRLRLERTNGFTAEDRIRFVKDTSPPETEIAIAANAWDNQIRKMFFRFRSSDAGEHVLFFRTKGSINFNQISYDRKTHNGEFLLGTDKLTAGDYEYYIQSTNFSGLTSQTSLKTFTYEGGAINTSGFDEQNYKLPMGRMLNETYDFDNDGLKEVVMTQYDENLSVGRLGFFEYQAGKFSYVDSLKFKPILIVKDVVDADGDGLEELLVSVNDSTYILEQENEGQFPKQEIYKNENNGLFAAQFGDTDGDGQQELLLKDFEHYYVYERNGEDYSESAKLENLTPDNSGSNAPRALVGDFDGDGKAETIYQDFDGDVIIYEETNGQYIQTFADTTYLIREESSSYLTKGDFDGDGLEEFFVALHTSNKRNEDFEYTPLFWWLRIFESTGDNTYEVVWEDYLYDVDNSTYNAATAGNIDEDSADELIFSTFPRTYILDHTGTEYRFDWFFYGNLMTHHLIADFNENGINEVGIGLGDTTVFYEKRLAYKGPTPVTSLRGEVLTANSTQLQWQAVPNATEYLIYRGILEPGNTTIRFFLIDSTQQQIYNDPQATFGERYLYVLRTKNPALTPSLGEFDVFQTNFVVLRPHENTKVDSVRAIAPNQVEIFFDQAVVGRDRDKGYFTLNNEHTAEAIIPAPQKDRLIVSFPKNFREGFNQLVISPVFLNAERGRIDPRSLAHAFNYQEIEEDQLILTQWEPAGDKEAILTFNYPLTTSALDSSNYTISPFGSVTKVAWASDAEDAVKVAFTDARIGALGYAVSITAENVCSINELCVGDVGNTATFSSHKNDLSEVFVYPNPARPHDLFDGVRFANLTQQATIKIYTVSGRFVNELEETDGDGGVEWNLRDQAGQRIKPGIYLFHVTTEEEGVEEVLRKFSVVE